MKDGFDIKSVVANELKNKMNIGPDGKMELTPQMMAAYGISLENAPKAVDEYGIEMDYKVVDIKSISKRNITSMEYDALPKYSRGGIPQICNLGTIFVIVVLGIMAFEILTNPGFDDSGLMMKVIVIAVLVLVLVVALGNELRRGISRNSEISSGKVVFCNTRRTGSSRTRFYLTIELDNTHEIVKEVRCYNTTFRRVGIGSKVYICKGYAYAAE